MLSLDDLVDIRTGSRAFAQGGFSHGDVEFQVIMRGTHDQNLLYVWYSSGKDRRAIQKIQIQ